MDPSALDRKKKTDFLVEFPDHFAIGSHVYLGLTGCTDTLTPNNLLDVWIASWLHGWDGMEYTVGTDVATVQGIVHHLPSRRQSNSLGVFRVIPKNKHLYCRNRSAPQQWVMSCR